MQHQILAAGGRQTLSLFADGDVYVAVDTHPNWNNIIKAVYAEEEGTDWPTLFDASLYVVSKFTRLSTRVTASGGELFLDGDPLHGTLSDAILRGLEHEEDVTPLVNFLEKVSTNPSQDSRDSLYAWMTSSGKEFVITPDGDFIGYKGVRADFGSSRAGDGIVNGVQHGADTHLDHTPGNVIEMPRSEVDDNRGEACGRGLHVGTWDHSRSFGTVRLAIRVNPRDVVSVPTYDNSKMRVCRYVSLGVRDEPIASGLVSSEYEPPVVEETEEEIVAPDPRRVFDLDQRMAAVEAPAGPEQALLDLTTASRAQLREEAKRVGVTRASKMTRGVVIKKIRAARRKMQ